MYATALTSLSVGTAVLGMVAGFFALRRGASASRAVNGMAGAAVLIGLITAVAHLAVEIMGGAGTYYCPPTTPPAGPRAPVPGRPALWATFSVIAPRDVAQSR